MNEKHKELENIEMIKSFTVLKKILSLLWCTKKLYLFIYNKKFQNKLSLNIETYKNFSRRYKIVEKNGKGKEYLINTNKVIFVGEYLNGKRNGKCEEYYNNGILKFEGEYLNGKISTGKKYDTNGNIILELKDGFGKEYYNNGILKFKGEYINDKRLNGQGYDYFGNENFCIKNGKGKVRELNYYGKLEFEGEYINGLKNGKGKEYDTYGNLIYEGEYLNGKRDGKGKEYNLYYFLILIIGVVSL